MKTRQQIQTEQKGFTLIELAIVMVVMAILASIAYPTYLDSVRKGRRSDGIAALSSLQLVQQRLRTSCRFYAQTLSGANSCGANSGATAVKVNSASPEGYYAIAITAGTASTTAYTATATAQGDQAKDSQDGVSCTTLTLTVNAANPNGARTPTACW